MADTIKRAVVRVAVDKALKDIRANPNTGMKNLSRMADMFTFKAGSRRGDFFDIARTHLNNANSPYRQLALRVVLGTDPGLLANFGMNLGYNALYSGGARAAGQAGGVLPWTLFLHLDDGGVLDAPAVEAIVTQGRQLGIYSYMLFAGAGHTALPQLAGALAAFPDCAFILFAPPACFAPPLVKKMRRAANTMAALRLDAGDTGQARAAVDLLAAGQILAGGYLRQPLGAAGVTPALLDAPAGLDLPLLFLVRETADGGPQGEDDVFEATVRLREGLTLPVFPIDLYPDVTQVGQGISGKGCIAAVDARANLTVHWPGAGRAAQDGSVLTRGLKSALAAALRPEGAAV